MTLESGLTRRLVAANLTRVGLFSFMYGRYMYCQVVLLPKSSLAQHALKSSGLLMDSLDVFLQMVLPLEPMGTDGTYVRLAAVRLLLDRRLVN